MLSSDELKIMAFSKACKEANRRLPDDISLALPSGKTNEDIQNLKEKGLLCWDFNNLKQPFKTPVSNPEHQLSCIAYYGNTSNGYYCVGYVLGCVNKESTAIEINFIEKRSDAGVDLKSNFLPVIVDAFTAYGLLLNVLGQARINKLVLVGPVEGVRHYYESSGWQYSADYLGTDAYVSFIDT
ncbi:hypothetical protein [Vibrio neonatus]|uniref:hypothetical protein n=1 Tax=Vibrio neonatus TaxID=278860 RepID=UPI0021C39285|nr:hypothetical protein [Vibrio neonatus]